MDVLKNFLFPKTDFKRDIICAKIWFLYGKRLLANNMTGHADVRLCELGAVNGLLNECFRRYFFSLSSQRSKQKNNNAWSQVNLPQEPITRLLTSRPYFQLRICFQIPNPELRKIGKSRIPKNLLATPTSRVNFSPYKHLGLPSQVNSVQSRRDNQSMRKSC